MPELNKPVTNVDPWKTSKETWQYVSIPDEDPTGMAFPTITLNKITFAPGQTYQVPLPVALYVKDRVKAYTKSVTRLFSPVVDRVALREVSVGSTSPATPSGDRPGYVDASQVNTL
jgi:hypothetical protein